MNQAGVDWAFGIGMVLVLLGGFFLVNGAAFSDLRDHLNSGDPRRIEHATGFAQRKGLETKNFNAIRKGFYTAAVVCYLVTLVCLFWR